MPLTTRVTRLLKIEHPVVQGGMHFVAYAELSAAVSNAGGLGVITALTQPSPEKLREEIHKVKALTKEEAIRSAQRYFADTGWTVWNKTFKVIDNQ